jgi:hypothetical protein
MRYALLICTDETAMEAASPEERPHRGHSPATPYSPPRVPTCFGASPATARRPSPLARHWRSQVPTRSGVT